MKRILSVFVVCSLCLSLSVYAASPTEGELRAKLHSYLLDEYSTLEASPLPSGIFYDLVLPLSKMNELDGSKSSPAIDSKRWLQAAHELKRASLSESSPPSHFDLRQSGNKLAKEHAYPIAFLNFRYESLKPETDPDKVITFENDQIVAVNMEQLESKSMFAASTLCDWTYRGNSVRFRIDFDSFYFTNIESPLQSLEVDFDDGLGYRFVPDKSDILVLYNSVGMKSIRIRAKQSDGIELNGSFRFDVRTLDTPTPHETWQLQAAVSHAGVFAQGEAYIYLSDEHTSLTNPVILAEGLDLGNVLNWDELYALMNEQNLLEDMRALGYDAVVLNYTESTTYIQANAYLVAELLNQVNQTVLNGTTSALVGTSMGGLTTRFALTYMEANSQPHHVRTWISFDAPHTGANIPLGIQYWANFFASQSAEAEASRDALNSPAAKQLLVTHFTDPASTTPAPDPMRAGFMSELGSLGGYPDQPRRVAIANGSGTMQGVGFNPGDQIILWEYRSFLVDIDGNVWAQHNTQTRTIFDGMINIIWPLPDEYQTVTVSPVWPWDNAPGGLSPTMQELADVEAPYGDIIALHLSHCFIPSISSLDLAVADPFYNIAGNPDLLALSSFDALYFPVENQDHVSITPENYWWVMQEIVETLPEPQITA
ncbi:GPI inositol-deacylase, partial [bacterium]|nr:GPI inositol-deacylase [bacterium]